MAETRPAVLPFEGAKIPFQLKATARWAPWTAQWNAKRGKFDKIPKRADVPEYGLSTASPDRWFTFAAAAAAYERGQPLLAGVGYVLTKPHGIVGVDLDGCVHDGQVADWAREIVDALASYTEISPSGNGLRIFCEGAADDWTNHTVGVEVYGGAEPRFLTVTGAHLVGTPLEVLAPPAGALEALRARYSSDEAKSETQLADMPEVLDDLVLPDPATLELPYAARDFLESGEHKGDRSRAVHAAAVALYQCGLADDEVFSLLAANPHAMEVALDHRRQDPDRALLYLWREHCLKAKPKGTRKVATAEDFDDVSAAPAPAPGGKAIRFQFQTLDEFSNQPLMSWLVKKVMPKAALGVIFGPTTAGKTFFALDLAMHLARGVAWFGNKVNATPVAYVCAEDPAGFSMRVRAYRQYHGLEAETVPLFVLGRTPSLLERDDTRDLIAALRAMPVAPGVVFFDTLSKVTLGADENSSQDMGRALAHCEAIHRATGAMVVLVAHPGKDSSKGVRGWSGLVPAADMTLALETEGDYRCATVVKVKNGVEGTVLPFRLNGVVLGQDEDGDEISSAVLLPAEKQAARRARPKYPNHRLLLETAVALLGLNDVLTTDELLVAAAARMHDERPDTRLDNCKRAAAAALDALVKTGYLRAVGGLVRIVEE